MSFRTRGLSGQSGRPRASHDWSRPMGIAWLGRLRHRSVCFLSKRIDEWRGHIASDDYVD